MTTIENDRIIDANPTKEFFIDMLTRDTPLGAAVIDLVDNSVDGALRIRPNRDFEGLRVEITVAPDEFRIEDNCGGISVELARRYPFHFGRPDNAPSIPHSVGQFGDEAGFAETGKDLRIESAENGILR